MFVSDVFPVLIRAWVENRDITPQMYCGLRLVSREIYEWVNYLLPPLRAKHRFTRVEIYPPCRITSGDHVRAFEVTPDGRRNGVATKYTGNSENILINGSVWKCDCDEDITRAYCSAVTGSLVVGSDFRGLTQRCFYHDNTLSSSWCYVSRINRHEYKTKSKSICWFTDDEVDYSFVTIKGDTAETVIYYSYPNTPSVTTYLDKFNGFLEEIETRDGGYLLSVSNTDRWEAEFSYRKSHIFNISDNKFITSCIYAIEETILEEMFVEILNMLADTMGWKLLSRRLVWV